MTIKAQTGDVEPRPYLYACRQHGCPGYGNSYSTAVAPGQPVMTTVGPGRIEGIQCPFCQHDMELIASAD